MSQARSSSCINPVGRQGWETNAYVNSHLDYEGQRCSQVPQGLDPRWLDQAVGQD